MDGDAVTESVLVVGPSWVGDMVMAQSLFKLLKERVPGRAVDVLAPGWSLPIVERMPEIRSGIALDMAHGELGIRKRRRIAEDLPDYGPAIVLPRPLKAALVPFFSRIRRRTGYRGEGRRPVVAFWPVAEYGPAKCWPLEYFVELALRLDATGYGVWVLGSAKDQPAGNVIARGSNAINLCGRTSLADAIDLLALAAQAVSNDSGLMHIAAAVGTHVHGIYGSSSPAFTPPLTPARTIHYLAMDCSPCFRRECPLGHLRCLKDIDPLFVAEKIDTVALAPART